MKSQSTVSELHFAPKREGLIFVEAAFSHLGVNHSPEGDGLHQGMTKPISEELHFICEWQDRRRSLRISQFGNYRRNAFGTEVLSTAAEAAVFRVL